MKVNVTFAHGCWISEPERAGIAAAFAEAAQGKADHFQGNDVSLVYKGRKFTGRATLRGGNTIADFHIEGIEAVKKAAAVKKTAPKKKAGPKKK